MEHDRINRPPRRVLVAEDDPIVRRDLCDLLRAAGFDVCGEARNGEEAVELAGTTCPDLVLMDKEMPRLDGLEAARAIRAERSVAIVMLTGHTDEKTVAEAVGLGVFGYLVKPFRESELVPTIRAALARHAEAAVPTPPLGLTVSIASRRRGPD